MTENNHPPLNPLPSRAGKVKKDKNNKFKINGARIIKTTAAALVFVPLSIFLFYFTINAPVNYNEHDYITQAVLWRHFSMYQDFCYVHMPWLPIIYGIFYQLTGTTHYLLAGRCFTFFFTLVSALVVFLASFRFSKSFYLSLLLAVLLCLNNFVMFIMMESSNYMMPFAFALIAYYFFIIGVSESRQQIWLIALSGFFFSAAAGARSLYAPLGAAFVITGILYPRSLGIAGRIKKVELPLAAGMLAGQVPTIYYLSVAFNNFIFNNFIYHRLITEHHRMLGNYPRMSFPQKLSYWLEMFVNYPEISLMTAGALALLIILIIGNKYYKPEKFKNLPMEPMFTLLSIAILWGLVFFPTPMWRQYYAMPVPFTLILIAYCQARMKRPGKYLSAMFFIAVLVLTIFLQAPGFKSARDLFADFDGLTSIRVHDIAIEIRKSIKDWSEDDKIATLFPVFVLESDLTIYNELATGPFIYEIGDMIPAKYQSELVYASPNKISDILDREPPRAMLVSDTGFDALMLKYAQNRNYQRLDVNFHEFPRHGKFSLYVRPNPEGK